MTREIWIVALVVAFSGCRCGCGGEKREIGLARSPNSGEPVVVVDRPVEGGGGGGGSMSVYSGPMTPEAEPNDERGKAGALGLPGGIDGTLGSPTDIDFYKIDAGPARLVNVRLSGPAAEGGGADLVLTLYDADGKQLAQSDRGPAGTLEALPNFGLAQGAVHFLSVSSFAKKEKRKPPKAKEPAAPAPGDKPAAPGSYQLTAEVLRPATSEEVEPNDDPAGAREVLLDEEMSGYAGWSKDRDHWKLSLAGFRGGYVLDLSVEGVEGVGLTADLVGEGGKPIASRKSDKGRGLRVRGLLPPAGAKFWLIRLAGSKSNPEVAYKLKTSARELADGDESEPDDDAARAITVGPLGDGQQGERRGYLDGGDVDAYKFEGVREPLSMTFSIEPPSGVDVSLRVMLGSKEIVKADTGKVGAREEVDVVRLPPGEALVVMVGGTALGDEPDPYVLRWTSKADAGGAAPAPAKGGEDKEAPPSDDPYE